MIFGVGSSRSLPIMSQQMSELIVVMRCSVCLEGVSDTSDERVSVRVA